MQIHTFWDKPKLPLVQYVCLQSWLHHGYEVYLHTYRSIENVPHQVNLCSAEQIISEEAFAGQWQRFRCAFLYRHGGTWMDADVVLLAPIPEEFANPHSVATDSEECDFVGRDQLNLYYSRAPKDAEFLYHHLQDLWKIYEDPKDVIASESLRKHLWKANLRWASLPAAAFCPLPRHQWKRLFLYPTWQPAWDRTVGVKLWADEMTNWRYQEFEKVGRRGCFIWWLAKRYLGVDLRPMSGYHSSRRREQDNAFDDPR